MERGVRECMHADTSPDSRFEPLRLQEFPLHRPQMTVRVLHGESNRGQASPRTTIQCMCQPHSQGFICALGNAAAVGGGAGGEVWVCVRIAMAGWLHGVFVGEWLFVFPLCGFSLSLFCNCRGGMLRCTAGVGWSSRGSRVCVTMLTLQFQC